MNKDRSNEFEVYQPDEVDRDRYRFYPSLDVDKYRYFDAGQTKLTWRMLRLLAWPWHGLTSVSFFVGSSDLKGREIRYTNFGAFGIMLIPALIWNMVGYTASLLAGAS